MPPKKKRKKNIVPVDQRHLNITDEQLQEKREDLKNKNTIKANKKADKVFSMWLRLRGIHTDYWDLSVSELDDILCKFYFEVRTEEGERYKTSSLGGLRYALNRCLHEKGFESDIVHSPQFVKSSKAFSDACKELKALGKGDREHYKEIIPQGNICKSYLSIMVSKRKIYDIHWPQIDIKQYN